MRCFPGWAQQIQYSAAATDSLLRRAVLIQTETQVYVGCIKDNSPVLGAGWQWVDDTPANNLNCGVNCNIWAVSSSASSPRFVGTRW